MGGDEKRIAVVDDEDDLREAVVEYLAMNGFSVSGFDRAASFREALEREAFDVAILDIAMPGEDGLSLARWMRAKGRRAGIIFANRRRRLHRPDRRPRARGGRLCREAL